MKKPHRSISHPLTSLAIIMAAVSLSAIPNAYAQDGADAPVDLQADSLVHNQDGESVTASGDVILKQSGKTVKADQIIYHINQDKVVATGSVVFIDVNGDTHKADSFEFNNALQDGFVEKLTTLLADGSRLKASNGRHINGVRTVMKDAHYTPCKLCESNPEKPPLWQIRASEIVHNKEKKDVNYRNARFEIKGVPVAYLPYFSHPDGTVDRKSGFVSPGAGFTSDLGAFVESNYYWSIAPDKDLTVGLRAHTREAPLAIAEWRQRWENASLKAFGSFTNSERTIIENGNEVKGDREVRGHLKLDSLWDINEKWRSGVRLDVTSDDQYLRQYDFDNEDVLENEIFAERFSGRNYAVARLLAFQDVRVDEISDEDQPNVARN